jgi:hypothetical protein
MKTPSDLAKDAFSSENENLSSEVFQEDLRESMVAKAAGGLSSAERGSARLSET